MSRGALAGLRVAVTRTPEQADALTESLEREGAHVASFPLIRIEPVLAAVALANLLRQPADWVVFTSANAVRLCGDALSLQHAAPAEVLRHARIAAVGPATAGAAAAHGLAVAAVPDAFLGERLAAAMQDVAPLAGRRVFWPRAEAARPVVAQALRSAGATVEEAIVYRSVPDLDGAHGLARRILQRDIDVVTFTSPSCVHSLAAVLPEPGGVKVATIGPVTADAARMAGYPVDIVAGEYTAEGLVQAVIAYLRLADS